MGFKMFDPSIFDSFDLDKIAKESTIHVRQTEKPPVSLAALPQRILFEVVAAARTRRGAEQAIAAYSDMRQSKKYPRPRAGVKCHICISRPSGYRIVCNAQRGDQEMGRCSIEVQDYGRAKAHLLGWIQIGERWIDDTWSEPPSGIPMSEIEVSIEDSEAEDEEGLSPRAEEDT